MVGRAAVGGAAVCTGGAGARGAGTPAHTHSGGPTHADTRATDTTPALEERHRFIIAAIFKRARLTPLATNSTRAPVAAAALVGRRSPAALLSLFDAPRAV